MLKEINYTIFTWSKSATVRFPGIDIIVSVTSSCTYPCHWFLLNVGVLSLTSCTEKIRTAEVSERLLGWVVTSLAWCKQVQSIIQFYTKNGYSLSLSLSLYFDIVQKLRPSPRNNLKYLVTLLLALFALITKLLLYFTYLPEMCMLTLLSCARFFFLKNRNNNVSK